MIQERINYQIFRLKANIGVQSHYSDTQLTIKFFDHFRVSHKTRSAFNYDRVIFLKNLVITKQMQHQEESSVEAQIVECDHHLGVLFNDFENNSKLPVSTNATPTIVFDEPEHYDPKDIQKDYKSQCVKGVRKIKKKKRPKVGVTLGNKIRKERKNKLYIQMLENRIFQLQKQVEALKKVNKMSKQTLIKNQDSDHIVNGFFVNRQRHYQKLFSYIKQSKIDEQKFMEQYSMLRIRQGALGKDRIKVINYYFKELSEIMITDVQKYVLKTAQEETDLFDPNYKNFGAIGSFVEQWRKDIVSQLQLTPEKIIKIEQIKNQVTAQRVKMDEYFGTFYEMKLKITQSSRKMEMIYDRLNESFSPREIAKCLCLIEKYKFEKGFSIEDIFKSVFQKLQQEQKQCYNPDNLYEII